MDLYIFSGFQSFEVSVIFFDVQIVPAVASGSTLKVTCYFDWTLTVFDSLFALWHNNMSQVYLIKFLLQAGIIHFSKESWLF